MVSDIEINKSSCFDVVNSFLRSSARWMPNNFKMSLYTKQCEICSIHLSKYRCPRCGTVCCSLQCTKMHKNSQNCSGIRDKTGFVAMENFNDLNLLSDYRFLEDAERTINNANKANKLRGGIKYKPKFMCILQTQARKRGTCLQVLPSSFTRHKNNKSFFDFKKQNIDWTIEWLFDGDNSSFISSKVIESKTLREAFDDFLNETALQNPITELKLKNYIEAFHRNELKIFFRHEKLFKNLKNRFHELDLSKSLSENFKSKTILEYPTLIVVNKTGHKNYE